MANFFGLKIGDFFLKDKKLAVLTAFFSISPILQKAVRKWHPNPAFFRDVDAKSE